MPPAKCRLFVIVAQQAEVAVIIRRGPSDWYHLTRWDMKNDTFLPGSWFHGRIYEERCDLSPDGHLFLYFAYKHIRVGKGSTDSFTAISRAPWLHALVLWPQGMTYGGGGRFHGMRMISLRGVGGTPYPELPRTMCVVPGSTALHESSGEIFEADWSGRDHHRRLIYTIGGKLFRVTKNEPKLLADFTDLRPDPQPPPDHAKRPL